MEDMVKGLEEVRGLVATAETDEDWEKVEQAAEKMVDEVETEAEQDAGDDAFALLGVKGSPCKLCDVPGKPYMSDLVLDWGMCLEGCTDVCKFSLLNELDCFIEALHSLLGYGAWALEEADGNEEKLGFFVFLELDGIHRMAMQGLRFHAATETLEAAYKKRSMKAPLGDLNLRQLLIRALKIHKDLKKKQIERK